MNSEVRPSDAESFAGRLKAIFDNPALSSEERMKQANQVMDEWNAPALKIESFKDDFSSLKKKDEDPDVKISQYAQKLDALKDAIGKKDFQEHMWACEADYGEAWHRLDPMTQSLIATASVLFDLMSPGFGELDFSPIVIEFCRAFENEMKGKLFDGFVKQEENSPLLNEKKGDGAFPSKDDKILFRAIEQDVREGSFFLSLGEMVNLLKGILVSRGQTYLLNDLKPYLERSGWYVAGLCADEFIRESKKYTFDYRNSSAHPHILGRGVAESCQKDTKSEIDYLLRQKQG